MLPRQKDFEVVRLIKMSSVSLYFLPIIVSSLNVCNERKYICKNNDLNSTKQGFGDQVQAEGHRITVKKVDSGQKEKA